MPRPLRLESLPTPSAAGGALRPAALPKLAPLGKAPGGALAPLGGPAPAQHGPGHLAPLAPGKATSPPGAAGRKDASDIKAELRKAGERERAVPVCCALGAWALFSCGGARARCGLGLGRSLACGAVCSQKASAAGSLSPAAASNARMRGSAQPSPVPFPRLPACPGLLMSDSYSESRSDTGSPDQHRQQQQQQSPPAAAPASAPAPAAQRPAAAAPAAPAAKPAAEEEDDEVEEVEDEEELALGQGSSSGGSLELPDNNNSNGRPAAGAGGDMVSRAPAGAAAAPGGARAVVPPLSGRPPLPAGGGAAAASIRPVHGGVYDAEVSVLTSADQSMDLPRDEVEAAAVRSGSAPGALVGALPGWRWGDRESGAAWAAVGVGVGGAGVRWGALVQQSPVVTVCVCAAVLCHRAVLLGRRTATRAWRRTTCGRASRRRAGACPPRWWAARRAARAGPGRWRCTTAARA